MADVSRILPQRLQERLDATGKSKRAVSLAIGAHAGYVRDLFDPERFNVPSALRLQALAAELGTTTEYLLGEVNSPDQVRSEVGLRDFSLASPGADRSEPPIPLVGTGDCAALAVEDSETHKTIEVERSSFDPDYHVRMIARPPALAGARDIYAIEFRGESMQPRFEPGEIGVVDPGRTPRPRDYVVVQIREGESEQVGSVMVKRLVRQTASHVELEQFNPPLTFALPRERVARLHRIVDLLFS